MKTFSEILADYIHDLTYDDLPPAVITKCKQIVMDTIGVMVFGSEAPWSRILLDYFVEQGGTADAKIVCSDIHLPASSAAFVNGTMAHSFDYDDDLAACHIASCIIPAVLAMGQKVKASGKELITAITVGYDLTVRTAETLDGHHLYAMGFHPTPVCGVIGAVGAVSKLLKLDKEQIKCAFGIAGSFPSGSLEWLSDGSMTKRFHGGKAASEGIISASLAQKGFSAPRTAFEGENGIFKIYQVQRPEKTLVEELGQRFDVLKSYLKYYPCCTCNGPVIDAILDLKERWSLQHENIRKIEVKLRNTCFSLVGKPIEKKRNPDTILDAQMSAPYCIAVALLDGEAFPQQFTLSKLKDPTIKEIMQKISVEWDESMELEGSPRPVPAEIVVLTTDGKELRKRVDYQKGTYRNPLTDDEIKMKFSMCVEGKFSETVRNQLITYIDRLEYSPDVTQIPTN